MFETTNGRVSQKKTSANFSLDPPSKMGPWCHGGRRKGHPTMNEISSIRGHIRQVFREKITLLF